MLMWPYHPTDMWDEPEIPEPLDPDLSEPEFDDDDWGDEEVDSDEEIDYWNGFSNQENDDDWDDDKEYYLGDDE